MKGLGPHPMRRPSVGRHLRVFHPLSVSPSVPLRFAPTKVVATPASIGPSALPAGGALRFLHLAGLVGAGLSLPYAMRYTARGHRDKAPPMGSMSIFAVSGSVVVATRGGDGCGIGDWRGTRSDGATAAQ